MTTARSAGTEPARTHRRARGTALSLARAHGTRVIEDLQSEAWRPGVAEPIAIHIRPELRARLRAPRSPSWCPAPRDRDPVGRSVGVPLVVDDRIPAAPGYEIHRAAPEDAPGTG